MSLIGVWIARSRGVTVTSLAHLVESEIADRYVTRCGREMRQNTGRGFASYAESAVPRCKFCVGRLA